MKSLAQHKPRRNAAHRSPIISGEQALREYRDHVAKTWRGIGLMVVREPEFFFVVFEKPGKPS